MSDNPNMILLKSLKRVTLVLASALVVDFNSGKAILGGVAAFLLAVIVAGTCSCIMQRQAITIIVLLLPTAE